MNTGLTWFIDTFRIGFWPTWIRKPLIQACVRRKSLESLVFRSTLHGFSYEGDAANLIDYHILSRGAFEPGLTRLLQTWGQHHGGQLLLDVGANVGVHAIGASRTYRKVIAVEPFPPLVARLRETIRRNEISNVELVNGALGKSAGRVAFAPPDRGNLGTGKVVSDTIRQDPDLLQVEIFTGDALLREYREPLAAIKIDVEGFEGDVLEGLRQSIETCRPLVVCELLSTTAAAADAFRSRFPGDYRFFSLVNIKQPRFSLCHWTSGAADVVAIPGEQLSVLESLMR